MEILNYLVTFTALTLLEIVLGIDNLVLLAILSHRLPRHQQARGRRIGLTLAWVTRLMLLATAVALTKLNAPLVWVFNHGFSGRDLFLIAGGMFLLYKSTQEIHAELEQSAEKEKKANAKPVRFSIVVAQIALLDIVFSLDSVLTAVGLTQQFWVMAAAITIAILAMIYASEPLSRFIERNPTIKMLALSFLILIGVVLIADGFGTHVPRGYIYFAMGFSLFVESLNSINRKRRKN